MTSTKILRYFAIMLAFKLSSLALALGDITYPEMEDYLENLELGGACTPEKYERMQAFLGKALAQTSEAPCSQVEQADCLIRQVVDCTVFFPRAWCVQLFPTDKNEGFSEPLKKNFKAFLKYGISLLEERKSESDVQEQEFAFMIGKNLLYNIISTPFKTRKMTFGEIVTFPGKLSARLRYKDAEARNKPLSLKEAQLEAKFLVDPQSSDPNRFLSPTDLEGKTPPEIAALDVREDHHIWHSERYMSQYPNGWDDFMAMMQRMMEKQVTTQTGLKTSYDWSSMQQIVWFDKFQESAGVHPKLRVRDVHGLKWKLKFGSEFFSEQLANFLYLSLGGKYNDINFAHTVENPVVLVFPVTKEVQQAQQIQKKKDPCLRVNNPADLQRCLDQKSKKPIKVTDYSLPGKSGVIDSSNFHEFMLADGVEKEDLLGHHYVALHQISLELRDKRILKRAGPAPHSTMGNEDDRAMRGMILFHFWVDNFDAKDDNGEGVLMPTPHGPSQLIEAPTDLGGAFRGSLGHGTAFIGNGIGINHYEEKDWLFVPALDKRHLLYPRMMTFLPESAKKARFADTLWMAKKIVRLPYETIKRGVDMTPLPDFYRNLLLYKLAKRKADIAKLYGLETLLDVKNPKIPEVSISFGCPGCDEAIAETYHLPLELIEKEKQTLGLESKQWSEPVIHKGRLAKCKDSLLVNLLEKYAYPEGLSRNHLLPAENPGTCRFRL